jgi:putative endonuclease
VSPSPSGGARGPHSGDAGEDLACEELRRLGFRILARNFRCRAGEIDVVAEERGTVVFVEVKERRGESHGSAVEAVTAAKRQKVIRAARIYAALHGLSDAPLRFDVVAIDWGPLGPRVRHDAGAFGES